MTKREAAIVSAYTGFLLGKFSDMHEYVEEVMKRHVYTHEMGDILFAQEIQEKTKPDFIAIQVIK